MIGDESLNRLQDCRILLGVTGSIAAYKACEVLRMLQRLGADVRVVLTSSAQHLVAPLTFETLSGHEVITELFPDRLTERTRHIKLAEWADCILICPATANSVGKIASGIADDFLSTVVMAARSPVLLAPAMDYQMIQNPIYRENCQKLASQGYIILDTEEGDLASGAVGPGRLADSNRIIDRIIQAVQGTQSLSGVRVLVTAGPTCESIDPVRFLTNRSSGKMGYALAEEAALRGADVTLVSGPANLPLPEGVNVHSIQTASEMRDTVMQQWDQNDILIMAAAVADYSPDQRADQKIKKSREIWQLSLHRTPDILAEAAARKGSRIVVGFALETQNGLRQAKEKLTQKNLDLICLNNPLEEGCDFGSDTNRIILLTSESQTDLPLLPKWKAAQRILDAVEMIRRDR